MIYWTWKKTQWNASALLGLAQLSLVGRTFADYCRWCWYFCFYFFFSFFFSPFLPWTLSHGFTAQPNLGACFEVVVWLPASFVSNSTKEADLELSPFCQVYFCGCKTITDQILVLVCWLTPLFCFEGCRLSPTCPSLARGARLCPSHCRSFCELFDLHQSICQSLVTWHF